MFKVILVAELVQLVRGKWRSIVTHNFVWYSPFGKHVLDLVLLIIAALVVPDVKAISGNLE